MGWRLRNLDIWKREIASATGFFIPNICLKDRLKRFLAANKYRGRIRDMRWGQRDVPISQTWVIGLLSVINTMRRPVHKCPQVIAAATMAYNSL